MRRTGQGYRAAAREFDISESTTKLWSRELKLEAAAGELVVLPSPPPKRPADEGEEELVDPTTEDTYAWTARKLKRLEELIARCGPRDAGALFRQAARFRQEFDLLEAKRREGTPMENLPRPEFLARLRARFESMPLEDLEIAIDVFAERQKVTVRFLGPGGRIFEPIGATP